MELIKMTDLNLDAFDKMVARMNTTKLTSNTTKITQLPDDFEPNNKIDHPPDEEADFLAGVIP